MAFAAIQCQIHFGDFQDDKHKPGLIENLREYLPEQYSSSWGAEKKILKLYRNHQGLIPLEAKHLYTKTARDLPTYGVTFFLVKEKQKGKKKMVPRLLGINSESILRLDEVTKEILQVWPLTHVKTYHAGKNETFTLNFGDYSEKEYSVKTNDAYRIRDILEGYIDIIRKRLCGPSSGHYAESGSVGQECVQSGRGNVMTHVVNTPTKVVEHSFVGPTRILEFEPGSLASTGTQVMTVQQIVVTNKGSTTQQVLSGAVPMRSDMSQELVKKLNRINSNSVKIVTLLTEPIDDNIQQARNIIASMEGDINIVQTGVMEAAEKQNSEEAKNKLLGQLQELVALLASSSQKMNDDLMNPEEVQDQARQIADLTTQMYFSLDPKTQRRSEFIRRSRQSFMEDDQSAATLRRASFIAAAGSATHAADSAADTLGRGYQGAALTDKEVEQLKASAVDKLGKLNAAVALFLTAHADSKNIDYDAAVNSMNTIKELLPELATDARTISHFKGEDAGKEIMDEMKALTEAARIVCMLTGCDDHEKIQDAAQNYAAVSGKLVYILGSGNPRVSADKENELLERARGAGDAAALLLARAHALAARGGPGAALVDGAGAACADRTRDLLTAAQLTAPTIREPHCQSALSAAAEGVAAAARQLALAWRPLAGGAGGAGEQLAACTVHLAKALDELKNAYADLGDLNVDEQEEQVSPEQAEKLKFVATIDSARGVLQTAQDDLDKPIKPSNLSDRDINELQDNIFQKLAQNNAAVGILLQTKSDPQNPNYKTAELALNTIAEVTPDVVKDARALLSSFTDERMRRAMQADIRAWCRDITDVCASAASDKDQDLDDAANKLAKSSKKLSFAFSPYARNAREQLMRELLSSAHEEAMAMAADGEQLAAGEGGGAGGGAGAGGLREAGRDVRAAARALRTTLEVTAPTLQSERCRGALAGGGAALAAAGERLAGAAAGLRDAETGCDQLAARLQRRREAVARRGAALQAALRAARAALQDAGTHTDAVENPTQRAQRLKFITSISNANDKLGTVNQLLDQPTHGIKLTEQQTKDIQEKLSQDIAQVNAAVASLLQAQSDAQNVDHEVAKQAIDTISELVPVVAKETNALSTACEDERARAAMIQDMHGWCDAMRAVCASAEQNDIKNLEEAACKLSSASGKMKFIISCRRNPMHENEVEQSAHAASRVAARMAEQAARGAGAGAGAGALPGGAPAALQARAAQLARAAAGLRSAAKLTAPSMHEQASQSALISSADAVTAAAARLVEDAQQSSDPGLKILGENLKADEGTLAVAIQYLKDICANRKLSQATEEAQNLKFVCSANTAQKKVDEIKILLNQPTHGIKLTEQQAKDVQEKLSQDIAQVNAAIVSLLQAQSDAQNVDYKVAEQSIGTISELVPTIAKETKALSTACKDEKARAAMIQDMHDWCDAIRAVCASAEQNDIKNLEEAACKLSSASSKMKFIISCRRNPMHENEVEQSAHAASRVAARMAEQAARGAGAGAGAGALPGGAPAALQARAAQLARAAAGLRSAAKLTAPSMHEQASQSALISSADAVTAAAARLVEDAQQSSDPGLKILGENLKADEGTLAVAIQYLKDICANRKLSQATEEAQNLKFVCSANTAQKKVDEIKILLNQPTHGIKLTEQQAKDVQEKLSQDIAQVNAAIVSLLQAQSDAQNVDYKVAEQSIGTISELVPTIAKETKALSTACKDEKARAAMIQDMHDWCDAIRAVCASAEQNDIKNLEEAACKLSSASSKMKFIISCRRNPMHENEVEQSAHAASRVAARMAEQAARGAGAGAGAGALPGGAPAALQARAAQLARAAAGLRSAAKLTAPSMHEQASQSALISSADAVTAAAARLVEDAQQSSDPGLKILGENLKADEGTLAVAIQYLKDICANRKLSQATEEAQNLKFVCSANTAQKKVDEIKILLNQPTHGIKLTEQQAKDVQEKLSQDIAQVNAAIVSLLQAQSDAQNVDYKVAEQSIGTISELVPTIAKETKALSTACKDEKARAAMIQDMHDWCDAIRAVCASAEQNDIKNLEEAACKLSSASSKMKFIISCRRNPMHENEVEQSAHAASRVAARMAEQAARGAGAGAGAGALPGGAPAALQARAAQLARAAAGLRSAAKLTAPSMHEQASQSALISSADAVTAAAARLVEDAQQSSDPGLKILGENLKADEGTLAVAIQYLKDICANSKPSQATEEAQNLKFVCSANTAQKKVDEIKILLNQPTHGIKLTEQQAKDVQEKLSQDIAQVNAAVVSLLQAQSDAQNVDYKVAEQSIGTISELVLTIAKETKALSTACKDEKARAAMIQDMHDWCDAIRAVCASAEQNDIKNLEEAACKLSSASGKMKFIISCRRNPMHENEVEQSAHAASRVAARMAEQAARGAGAGAGAGALPGGAPAALQARAAQLARAAAGLRSAAKLTAPSMHEQASQSALISSADAVTAAAARLVEDAQQASDPGLKILGENLKADEGTLAVAIQDLKDICTKRKPTKAAEDAQNLKFVASAHIAQKKIEEIEKLLDQPARDVKPSEQSSKDIQEKLANAMAQVNAALASLINAKSDTNQPNYIAAEKSLATISELLPQIVNDTKDSYADEAEHLRACCRALRAACAGAARTPQELIESAVEFSTASQKLSFVNSARKSPVKEQQIMQLSSSACDKAKQMADEIRQVASTMKGEEAEKLVSQAGELDDAAVTLQTVVQLAAPSLQCAPSGGALEEAAGRLARRAALAPHGARYRLLLERALDQLAAVIAAPADRARGRAPPPPPPVKRSSLSRGARVVSHSDTRRASQEWLHHMRQDADRDLESTLPPGALTGQNIAELNKKAEEEGLKKEKFETTADRAEENIQTAVNELSKLHGTAGRAPQAEHAGAARAQLEQQLGLAGTAAATLVGVCHPDAIDDYVIATQATETLSKLIPDIVTDTALLSNTTDEKNRSILLDHLKALCDAAKRLIGAGKNNCSKVNEVAVEFGDKSAGLLYLVAADVHPAQEKEVMSRARAVGDVSSSLAARGAGLAAGAAPHARALCDAGRQCTGAARAFVYTAKLVAPTVHHQHCQNSLITASHELSSQLRNFAGTWKTIAAEPQHAQAVADMTAEADHLEKLLESFRQDLAAGKLVKRREKIVIENTAIRQLATKIMELAQMRAECGNTAADKNKSLCEYADSLRAAVRALDTAAAGTKRHPHDLSKHQELEGAVQNLQISLLQSRPTLGDQPHNNVVDLTDFVKVMSAEAEKLLSTTSKAKAEKDQKELEIVKDICQKIHQNATKLLSPETRQDGDETSLDGILEVDQFGQDCENHVQKMKSIIDDMTDKELKDKVSSSSLPLIESCYYLRFATKSALATAQSASLDEVLDDLNELERSLDKLLVPGEGYIFAEKDAGAGAVCAGEVRSRLVGAACGLTRGAAPALPPALAAYVGAARARTDLSRAHAAGRVKKHLSEVIQVLKELTATASTRVATWEPVRCAEVAALTDRLIQVLESPYLAEAAEGEKQQVKFLKEADINRLLMPADVKIEGDPKQINAKLQQSASKLVMLSETLCQSAASAPPARTAPAAADAALQLAAAARSLPARNLAEAKRTEEASEEMCWATYNLLKAAELAACEPGRGDARDLLRAAAATLSAAVNKLARAAPGGGGLAGECGERTRALQAQLARLHAAPASPRAAPPYAHALRGARALADLLQNFKSDEPMSREEFSKSLNYVTTAVCNSTEYAAQCAYLISLSENNKEMAKEGLVDVPRLQILTSSMLESCYLLMRTNQMEMAKEEESKIWRVKQELQQALKEASGKTREAGAKKELTECGFQLDLAAQALHTAVNDTNASVESVRARALQVEARARAVRGALLRPGLLPAPPAPAGLAPQTTACVDDVMLHSKTLINKTQALIKEVKGADDDDDDGPMTWVTYNTQRKSVIDAFEALLNSLEQNGECCGLVDVPKEDEEDPDVPKKSFVQILEETARRWLRRPAGADAQRAGARAARDLLDIAQQMSEDMKGHEKDEMLNLITESRELIADCSNKYDSDKASALLDRLHEARRAVQRGAVTRVVEDLLHADAPLADFDILIDAERDESKRSSLLEKKLAELMSQLGRVTRTARLVARTGQPDSELHKYCEQTEQLAPALAHAARARALAPGQAGAVQAYRAALQQYAAALAHVRRLCDRAVDPLDFVQTAGETMSRMREESSQHNDPQLCAYTSKAIARLGERVLAASMSSSVARADPELRAALAEAQGRLAAAAPPPGTRASRLPAWEDTTAEILRTTGDVESALGGENIFKKLPEPDQPIYNAALSLHAAVRGWSARDNELVAVAKRMAVLMARLSDQMNTDRKRELIATSKSIVTESREVAALAKKLAQECADVRIKTNLLQVCERIPTISGQLKMLTTVKGSTLGNQGGEEDREAMNMLVTNAQNLMSSVQEVVKAAASASVKIASQRGPKWVRKNY